MIEFTNCPIRLDLNEKYYRGSSLKWDSDRKRKTDILLDIADIMENIFDCIENSDKDDEDLINMLRDIKSINEFLIKESENKRPNIKYEIYINLK